ncbi:hypothetical protein KUD97_07840 [Desulfovibrio desulfuricans]|uniref:Uncharacterized protein n=1 Tax=Desulfovibrio phage ProddE TaxID=2866661 RepID=A0AAE8XD94_9CAUD|nr:hypothetical protein [Desulfovibrio desulfuricans]UAJ16893.1 hypothetical protein CPT_ProddE_013 [Desulfovibrio phage ProddE]UIA98903.1 hypothetical protein KUD97_07840 [Desulfovibrio desulfuricans]
MKLKITKDANGCYTLWKITGTGLFGFGDKWPVTSSKNASVVLDEMRRILGSNIETGLLDVDCVEEEA